MKVNFKYQTSNVQSPADELAARLKAYDELCSQPTDRLITPDEINHQGKNLQLVLGSFSTAEKSGIALAGMAMASIAQIGADRSNPDYLKIAGKFCETMERILSYRHVFGTWKYAEGYGLSENDLRHFEADNTPESIRAQIADGGGIVTRVKVIGSATEAWKETPVLGSFVITTTADHKSTLLDFEFAPGFNPLDGLDGKEDV